MRTNVLCLALAASLLSGCETTGYSTSSVEDDYYQSLVDEEIDRMTRESNDYYESRLEELLQEAPSQVWWDEARDHVGEDAYVCGPVAGVGQDADDIFIDLGRRYPDNGRTTIIVWDVGWMDVPNGTACAMGRISTYGGRPQVEVWSAADVTFR